MQFPSSYNSKNNETLILMKHKINICSALRLVINRFPFILSKCFTTRKLESSAHGQRTLSFWSITKSKYVRVEWNLLGCHKIYFTEIRRPRPPYYYSSVLIYICIQRVIPIIYIRLFDTLWWITKFNYLWQVLLL